MKRGWITLLACFLLALGAQGWAQELEVTGEGMTRDRALQEALRTAVEQGVGAFVSSESKVQNARIIEDRIYTHTRGYVTGYRILREVKGPPVFRITLLATVDRKLLLDDIEALGILRQSMGNPRILVAYSRKGDLSRWLKDMDFVEEIYNGIVESLTDKQFRVADRQASLQFARQVEQTHDIDLDVNRAAAFGLKYQAEYTLHFSVNGELTESVASKGARLRIKGQLIDNTRAQVITNKAVESAATAQTHEVALERAAREGGKQVVTPMLDTIKTAWTDMQIKGFIYTIVMDGVDNADDVFRFADRIALFPRVKDAREMESGGGKTTFEAEYKGLREDLDRDILRAAAELGWKVTRVRAEGARSTWKRAPAPEPPPDKKKAAGSKKN